jgi:hypothetical protein
MDSSERRFNDEDFERPVPMPVAPVRPTPQSKPASLWGVVLAGVAALIIACGLGFLMIPVAGVALAAAGIVFVFVAIAAFHYVVWGWWLSSVIREDVEAEERAEAEYERLRKR